MTKQEINKGTEVVLGDKKFDIKPLSLKQLRKFMVAFKDMGSTEDKVILDDSDIDNMINVAAIILEKVAPELAADKEALEDLLDIKSFNILVVVAMGADPNE